MTERQRATSANAARIAVAGMIVAGGALAMATQAAADPAAASAVPYPTPVPLDPGAPPLPPGQPVADCRTHPWLRPRPHRPARQQSQDNRKPRIRLRQIRVGSRSAPSGIFGIRPRTRSYSLARTARCLRGPRRRQEPARAAAAARIHIIERTGVQRPAAGRDRSGRGLPRHLATTR